MARPGGPVAIFLNEGAGSAGSPRARQAVELARAALDADLHVTRTRDVAELRGWMDERLPGYETIVVAGGDGSLGVAFNALAGKDITLGYLPAGFGNATSHLLRLPRDPVELAAVLETADARPVDLVSVDGRLALFAGAGWDAIVAGRYAAAGARRLPGWAAAVARSVPDLLRRPPVRVEADGQTVHEGPMELAVVGTTPYFGRGLLVNPGARPDDGQLMLRVYPGPAPMLAAEAVRWAARRSPAAPGIPAREVTLRSLDDRPVAVQADGDLVGSASSWRFEVRPAAVRLIGRWAAARS
jgi:diacylglycerol kinase (ATP)